jgi:hypothetical protein
LLQEKCEGNSFGLQRKEAAQIRTEALCKDLMAARKGRFDLSMRRSWRTQQLCVLGKITEVQQRAKIETASFDYLVTAVQSPKLSVVRMI